ncbi:MAG: RNA polymerase sigma-70 factor (ECF subfamily) [Planctomycetota bacterium]|jgi:RNA polymerase sigma-70 factor (ECF subfamily)
MMELKNKTKQTRTKRVIKHPRRVRSPEEIRLEKELITNAQAGDMAAFESLVKQYEKRVFWVAFNLVNNVEDAKDIAQDAFLRVFKAIDRFDLKYNFYTWLYRIVVNLSIDWLRKKGKQSKVSLEDFPADPVETSKGPEELMRSLELGEEITSVLESMPDKYKTVILLRDVHELSCEEIAEVIDCTNATTRWRLHKAREIFREKWERVEV